MIGGTVTFKMQKMKNASAITVAIFLLSLVFRMDT